MDKVERFRKLVFGWFVLAAAGVGLIVGMLIMLVAFPPGDGTVICPPRLETATEVDITAYYQGMPPELTDIDREFEKACGLEWGEPHRVEPPEEGA